MSIDAPAVYFFDLRDDEKLVRVGFDGSKRIAEHQRNGQRFLAGLPAGMDYEKRIHSHFRDQLAPGFASTSIYDGEKIWDYVEWLVASGYATPDPATIEHLPRLPWEVISPLRAGAPRVEPSGQAALFPPSLLGKKERIARAGVAAFHASLSDEWYSPVEVIEAARAVMGGIDLDPASCPRANFRAGASAYYSETVDGLDPLHPWGGRVWMNPPYGNKGPLFVARLCREFAMSNVTEAIALLNVMSATADWFQIVFETASALCVSRGRWKFEPGSPDQACSSAGSGSIVPYWGPNAIKFATVFAQLGNVVLPARFDTVAE